MTADRPNAAVEGDLTRQSDGWGADLRIACDPGPKRWRLEGANFVMQPVGEITAYEAECLCKQIISEMKPDQGLLVPSIRTTRPASDPAPAGSGFVAVPEGWQLVPEEPTEEMLDAYWHAVGESREMRPRIHASARRYFCDMLAAAPSPPQADVRADAGSPLRSKDGHFACTEEHAVEAAYLLNTAEGVLLNAADVMMARGNVGDAIRDYVLGDATFDETMQSLREEAAENARLDRATPPADQDGEKR